MSSVRVLVVDDFEPWRRFVSACLQKQPELLIIAEAADGMAAVERAQELQPDLILLDIGLPKLNGIEVARRVRKLAPLAKILFTTQESSPEIIEEAFGVGANGYVVKADGQTDLLTAVMSVMRGEKFFAGGFAPGGPANGILPPTPETS